MKIILIEDSKTLADGLSKKLIDTGYIVDLFYDGKEGLYALETYTYDLLILDLEMPSIDGITIIKKLRSSNNAIPILIISARDKLDQRVLGLDTGADDYICKPFELEEVVARVNALLRRSHQKVDNIINYNDLAFDTNLLTLRKDNELVELRKRELSVFECFIHNLNVIISKNSIVEHITSIDDDFNVTAVETYVSRLRKKLGRSINIKTVRGLGYIMS